VTPANHNITIYRGCRFAETYTFYQTGTGDAVDLTGLSPFTAEVRRASGKPLILAFTVTDTDLDAGQITPSAEVEDTTGLPLGEFKWGIRDVDGNLYIKGTATIAGAIPEP